MSDMQWRKANGGTGTYSGPLSDLGHGIPRQTPQYGFRRALFDFAFGYASGFPFWDVIVFSLRSLFPQQASTAEFVPDRGDEDGTYVGTVYVICPQCGEMMPARVHAEIGNPDGVDDGESTLICTPDMTDIHAHVWTHTS